MNKQFCIIFLLIFFSLFAIGSVEAKAVYSLYDLVNMANEQSESIKIAKEDVFIAKQEEKRTLAILLPRATAYGSYNHREYQKGEFSSSNSNALGIAVNHRFSLNGKELIALDITKRGTESKNFSLESIRAQYILQVIQAFYNILSAGKFYEIAKSDVQRLTMHKNAVQEKLNVGNVTKTDLLRAKAELSKALTEREKAKNVLLQSRASLMNLVAVDKNFTLNPQDIYGLQKYKCNPADIESQTLQTRVEIKEAKKNLEIADKTVKFKRNDFWPSLSVEAGYRSSRVQSESSHSSLNSDTQDGYITGELVFTLFDGGLKKADEQQALANHRKAQQALALQKKRVALESESAFLDYEMAKSTLNNLQDELRYAKETYMAVQMQFNYGMADSVDIMDANTLLVSSQRRISDAQYKYYLSVIKLLYSKGELASFFLDHPDMTAYTAQHGTPESKNSRKSPVYNLLRFHCFDSLLYTALTKKIR